MATSPVRVAAARSRQRLQRDIPFAGPGAAAKATLMAICYFHNYMKTGI